MVNWISCDFYVMLYEIVYIPLVHNDSKCERCAQVNALEFLFHAGWYGR